RIGIFNHAEPLVRQHGQTRTKIKDFKQKVRIVRVVSGKFSSFSFLCIYPGIHPVRLFQFSSV
ncbi:MAG: hypothetical protein LBQ38_11995, partial [Spirochaetaceae bacterium]|nr:hypothetical protein [Spirochaetaceae bacterium]